MYYVMNWKWYTGTQLVAILSGMFLGWACNEWHKAYEEAREAGAVA